MRTAICLVGLSLSLAACGAMGEFFPDFDASAPSASGGMSGPATAGTMPPAGAVMPETLVACRGHVLVPAMGMTFVPAAGRPPSRGQYLREESLTPPYRVLPPGAAGTMDYVPSRLNIDLDRDNRIINLRCG